MPGKSGQEMNDVFQQVDDWNGMGTGHAQSWDGSS
jgi:hypothetical protein